MKIINVYQLFQNLTGEAAWQLWDGEDLVGVYQTRAAAREARLEQCRRQRYLTAVRISTGAA
jgi:hypothetical protein